MRSDPVVAIGDLYPGADRGSGDRDYRQLGASSDQLPTAVEQLAPRMREIATIVYRDGVVTLREIHAQIEDEITIYGLRTLLSRLVRRGILKSRRSGRHSEVVYLPAILTDGIRAKALHRLIESAFEGSIKSALITSMRVAHMQAADAGRHVH